MVQLDYFEDNLSAGVILSNVMQTFIQSCTQSKIASLMQKAMEQTVILSMPKFQIDFSIKLKEILSQLGINTLFSENVAYSKIKDKLSLHFKEVLHKTADEEETKTAGITEINVANSIFDEQVVMNINKPFLFLTNSFDINDMFLFITVVNDIN